VVDYKRLKQTNPVERFVQEGLRAQLKSGSLITGQLYVELDFFDTEPTAQVESRNGTG